MSTDIAVLLETLKAMGIIPLDLPRRKDMVYLGPLGPVSCACPKAVTTATMKKMRAAEGTMVLNTDDNEVYVYHDSQWHEVTDPKPKVRVTCTYCSILRTDDTSPCPNCGARETQ